MRSPLPPLKLCSVSISGYSNLCLYCRSPAVNRQWFNLLSTARAEAVCAVCSVIDSDTVLIIILPMGQSARHICCRVLFIWSHGALTVHGQTDTDGITAPGFYSNSRRIGGAERNEGLTDGEKLRVSIKATHLQFFLFPLLLGVSLALPGNVSSCITSFLCHHTLASYIHI